MEKKIFKGFYHIWAWQPFWSMDHTHFSNLSFSCPRRLRMKFEQHWPGGFRGKAIWNYQHFFHTNVWGPYKCIQKQTWPRRKKVKCQCMTTILATLADTRSRWYMQRFSHKPSSVLENKIFKCFFPCKCIRKQTWPCCKKVKCQCMIIILATLVDPCPWSRPRWLSWMRRATGDQKVAGSTPAEVGNILSWRLIMKYFLRSFSPFRWFKKGSCQFLAKECAQYWLTA